MAELLASLAKKFGQKLKPEVRVNANLIGGVRATVGDQVLDGSVRARLTDMQTALERPSPPEIPLELKDATQSQ